MSDFITKKIEEIKEKNSLSYGGLVYDACGRRLPSGTLSLAERYRLVGNLFGLQFSERRTVGDFNPMMDKICEDPEFIKLDGKLRADLCQRSFAYDRGEDDIALLKLSLGYIRELSQKLAELAAKFYGRPDYILPAYFVATLIHYHAPGCAFECNNILFHDGLSVLCDDTDDLGIYGEDAASLERMRCKLSEWYNFVCQSTGIDTRARRHTDIQLSSVIRHTITCYVVGCFIKEYGIVEDGQFLYTVAANRLIESITQ